MIYDIRITIRLRRIRIYFSTPQESGAGSKGIDKNNEKREEKREKRETKREKKYQI
ncbi:MAG: hypothetical protein KAT48_12280 [Bacteroidales bacterium]|nr:hypothetical protein [Bacteroidales bacterium]